MQAITLEVIQRVIFGSRDPELRDALRHALDMTGSMPNLIAMSLVRTRTRRFTQSGRAHRRADLRAHRRSRRRRLDPRRAQAAGATREELRDQLVTLLAAGHETTATALAWACERLARDPAPLDTDQQIDAFVKQVLTHPPRPLITARKTLQPYALAGPHGAGGRLRRRLHRTSPTAAADAAVHPVRRRNAPLPRRRVRDARDAGSHPCGEPAIHARARPARGRADAPPQRRPRPVPCKARSSPITR